MLSVEIGLLDIFRQMVPGADKVTWAKSLKDLSSEDMTNLLDLVHLNMRCKECYKQEPYFNNCSGITGGCHWTHSNRDRRIVIVYYLCERQKEKRYLDRIEYLMSQSRLNFDILEDCCGEEHEEFILYNYPEIREWLEEVVENLGVSCIHSFPSETHSIHDTFPRDKLKHSTRNLPPSYKVPSLLILASGGKPGPILEIIESMAVSLIHSLVPAVVLQAPDIATVGISSEALLRLAYDPSVLFLNAYPLAFLPDKPEENLKNLVSLVFGRRLSGRLTVIGWPSVEDIREAGRDELLPGIESGNVDRMEI